MAEAIHTSQRIIHRKLTTLDEVALRIHCATVSTSLNTYDDKKERWLPSVVESFNEAVKFLEEAERRCPTPGHYGGE